MLIQGFISQICVQWEQRVGTQIVDFPIFEQSSQLSNFEKVYYIGIESNVRNPKAVNLKSEILG